MTAKPDKTIAYIRVSSQRQVDEGNSLASQERRISNLASFKGLDLEPEDFLIEKGVSAGIPLWEANGACAEEKAAIRGIQESHRDEVG